MLLALVVDKPELTGSLLPRVAYREVRVSRISDGLAVAGTLAPGMVFLHGLAGERGAAVIRQFRRAAARAVIVAVLGPSATIEADRYMGAGADMVCADSRRADMEAIVSAAAQAASARQAAALPTRRPRRFH